MHAIFFYRNTPVEVLHRILLGACKDFLSHVMPRLSKEPKQQVIARVSAFSMSGFNVRMHGNVCRHYTEVIF